MKKLTQTNQVSNMNMTAVSYNVLAKDTTQTTIRNIKNKAEQVLVFTAGNTRQLEKENNDESYDLKWV